MQDPASTFQQDMLKPTRYIHSERAQQFTCSAWNRLSYTNAILIYVVPQSPYILRSTCVLLVRITDANTTHPPTDELQLPVL